MPKTMIHFIAINGWISDMVTVTVWTVGNRGAKKGQKM